MKKTSALCRVLAAALILASLCMIFLPWLSPKKEFAFLGGLSLYELGKSFWQATAEMMKDGFDLSKSTTTDILAGAAMVLLVVSAILGLVLCALGLRWGGIPYAGVSLIFALVFIRYFLGTFNDMFFRQYGVRPFHIGIGLILSLVLAIAAALCPILMKKTLCPADGGDAKE